MYNWASYHPFQKCHENNTISKVIFDTNKLKIFLRLEPRLNKYFYHHDSSNNILEYSVSII